MALETLFTNQTPTLTNVSEGQNTTLGDTITFADGTPVVGVQFWAPDTPLGNYQGAVWEVTADDVPAESGTGTLIATTDVVAAGSLTPSSFNILMLTSVASFIPDPAKTYVFGLRTSSGRYAATGAYWSGFSLTNNGMTGIADGTVTGIGTMNNGRFVDGSITLYPNKTFNSNGYFIGPVRDATTPPSEGSTDIGLGLAVDAAGARTSAGSTAIGLGLAVDAAGARASAGHVDFPLGLDLAAAGSRESAGHANVPLNLALETAGARPSSGSTDFPLSQALAATGARESAGVVDFDLALTLDATGSSPIPGQHQGSAAFDLELHIASSGSRTSGGAADIPLNLTVDAAGARPQGGSAAFTLNLALAATGSNGVCRVEPFPWACSPVATFAGECVAVPSFPGPMGGN